MATPQTSAQYAHSKGAGCPNCKSWNVSGESFDEDDGMARRDIRCLDCEAAWTEVFKLIGYENLELPEPSDELPCLFEIKDGEATGTVMPFCSEVCRRKTQMKTHSAWAVGTSRKDAFGYTPHCEECNEEIR